MCFDDKKTDSGFCRQAVRSAVSGNQRNQQVSGQHRIASLYRCLNYSDPFGLWPNTYRLFEGVWDRAIDKAKSVGNALLDLTPLGDYDRSANAFAAGHTGRGIGYALLGIAGSVPGGEQAVMGSKAAVRAGLSKLALGEAVEGGVREVLHSGAGQWAVHAAEGGGATVSRWVKGGDNVTSVLWTYIVDANGKVAGAAKQQYDAAGAMAGTFKTYR